MKTFKISGSSLPERMRLHYIDGLELSEEDTRIKSRLEAAHALILDDHETDRNAVSLLMKRFDISQATAYVDLVMAKNLFGNIRSSTKEGLRYLVTQWAIELFQMAKATKNLKAMDKALERITRANNLDKDDQDIPDASKIQPPVQLLSLNFNFINSPRFKLIDLSAQKAMLKLYDEFMEQVTLSPLGEYSDVFKLDDSTLPKKK